MRKKYTCSVLAMLSMLPHILFASPDVLVLSEVFPGLQTGRVQSAEEWLELYNPGDTDVQLNGLQINRIDGQKHSEEAFRFVIDGTDAKIAAKSYVVLAKSKDLGLGLCFDLPIVQVNMPHFRIKSVGVQFLCVKPKGGTEYCGQIADSHRWPKGHSRYVQTPGMVDNSARAAWLDSTCELKDGYFATPGLPSTACDLNKTALASHIVPCAPAPVTKPTGPVPRSEALDPNLSPIVPATQANGPLGSSKEQEDEDDGTDDASTERSDRVEQKTFSPINLRVLGAKVHGDDVDVQFSVVEENAGSKAGGFVPHRLALGISSRADGKLFFAVKRGILVENPGASSLVWKTQGIIRGSYFIVMIDEDETPGAAPVVFPEPFELGDAPEEPKIEVISAIRSNAGMAAGQVVVTYAVHSTADGYVSLHLRESESEELALVSGLKAAVDTTPTASFFSRPPRIGTDQFVFARFHGEGGVVDSEPMKITDKALNPLTASTARGCACFQAVKVGARPYDCIGLLLLVLLGFFLLPNRSLKETKES